MSRGPKCHKITLAILDISSFRVLFSVMLIRPLCYYGMLVLVCVDGDSFFVCQTATTVYPNDGVLVNFSEIVAKISMD